MTKNIQSTEHHFNIEEAMKYGIPKAILLYNIRFWLDKNRVNKKNINEKNGIKYYWTYNSSVAFEQLFPYMNANTIRRLLLQLEKDDNVLVSDVFNENKYDKTKWYTMEDYSIVENKSIGQNDQSENKSVGQNDQSAGKNDQPIPDSKPDSKLSSKEDTEETSEQPKRNYGSPQINQVIEHFESIIGHTLDGTKAMNRNCAKHLINKITKDYPDKDPVEQIKALIEYGYKTEFHGKNITNTKYLNAHYGAIINSIKELKTKKKKTEMFKI